MSTEFYAHEIEDVVHSLSLGEIVIVMDDIDRENEGDFIMLGDHVTPDAINFMATHGRGLICTPISQEIAEQLELGPMVKYNSSNHETAFTVSIDAKMGITTGISASDRSHTIKLLTYPKVQSEHFVKPGHIFPLIAKNGGVLERRGHTEATLDFCRLANASEVGVICEILDADGQMARGKSLFQMAEKFGLKITTIEKLAQYLLQKKIAPNPQGQNQSHHQNIYKPNFLLESFVNFPSAFGEFKIAHFKNHITLEEVTVIVKGEFSRSIEEKTLVRIHSECLTGDVFFSYRCDCRDQLTVALKTIEEKERGLIIYLRQEGRGIGLSNKLKAYALQDQGHDTVTANHLLGLPTDARVYNHLKDIFDFFHIDKVDLMTNNPKKIAELSSLGLLVNRYPMKTRVRKQNLNYLATKVEKLGHDLDLNLTNDEISHHDHNELKDEE